jgi:hypothetical protein
MRKKLLIIAAPLALVAVVAAYVASKGQAGGKPSTAPKSTFSVAKARSFEGFPIYDAGPSVAGLPLVAVLRRSDTPTNYVSFIYGDCQAAGDMGCAPPIEIQVWPACVRNPSLYGSPKGPTPEMTVVRGVPAAFVDNDGLRLEIQTGTSTVVVFARSRDEALTVADALRGVNVPAGRAVSLPPAAAGVMNGTLRC